MFTNRDFKSGHNIVCTHSVADDERLLAKLCSLNLQSLVFWVYEQYVFSQAFNTLKRLRSLFEIT